MATNDRYQAQRIAAGLEPIATEAHDLAERLGLSPYDVNYWIVDYDEMNELVAYGGFQRRYPHWRWGMQYDRQRKQRRYVGGKAFELVNNDDPAHAFLQESNSLADQKAVITHVAAHADFFNRNQWFADDPDAAAMLDRHADRIADYMRDPDIGRDAVERWIDHVACIEDTIVQHRDPEAAAALATEGTADDDAGTDLSLDDFDVSEDVAREVFDDEWLDRQRADDGPADPVGDVLAYLAAHGMAYDAEEGRAVEMKDWQRDVIEMLRAEAYYFAPQRQTKVMNEGWASYWESAMMGEVGFASADEIVEYADHLARVLGSPGLNPYALGKELWEYVENTANRREVATCLLRIDGVTPETFHETIDFDAVQEQLAPPAALDAPAAHLDELAARTDGTVDHDAVERAQAGDLDAASTPWKLLTYEGLARRHYSLVKPQYRGFLRRIPRSRLEEHYRYLADIDRYETIAAALADVDYSVGWDRMREIRESHNDVEFIDAFLTDEFVADNNYFTYEFSHAAGEYRVASTDADDVRKKLLLQFTNLGKPTVEVLDGNYANRNELLLAHRYNGIGLDEGQAKRTLERVFQLWGRPVNLATIRKEVDERAVEVARRRGHEPTPDERGLRLRYDGGEFEEHDLASDLRERISADDIDYDTKPDDWL
jgi:stage V sporulation protein R